MKRGVNMGGNTLFWFGIVALTIFSIADYLLAKGEEKRNDENYN